MTYQLTLPWWPKQLKANQARGGSHAARRAIAKRYKDQCILECRAQGLWHMNAERLKLTFTYCPKTKGPPPDLDNCVASSKFLIDAISHVTGIDDRHFTYGEPSIGDRVRGGVVLVSIEPEAA